MNLEPPPTLGTVARFRGDVVLMLTNRVGSLALMALSSIVMARELGPEGRGTVAVALSFVLILSLVGNLGFTTANPFFVAQDPTITRQIAVNAVWISISLGVALIGLGLATYELLPGVIPGISGTETLVALLALPAMLAMAFLQSIMLGERRTVGYNTVELALTAGLVLALVVGFRAFDMGPLGTIAVVGARYAVGAVAYWTLVRRDSDGGIGPDRALARRMIVYGLRVYVVNLLAFMIIRLDLLLVNGFLGQEEAGLYSITVAYAELLLAMPMVIAMNLFPRVAGGASAASTALLFRSLVPVFAVACLGAVALGEPLIALMYGAEFRESADLFYWLAPGVFALGMTNILGADFAGRGYPTAAVLVWVPGLAVNLGINIVFLKHGTFVAALSSSVAYAALLFLHILLFRRTDPDNALSPRSGELRGLLQLTLTRRKGEETDNTHAPS